MVGEQDCKRQKRRRSGFPRAPRCKTRRADAEGLVATDGGQPQVEPACPLGQFDRRLRHAITICYARPDVRETAALVGFSPRARPSLRIYLNGHV